MFLVLHLLGQHQTIYLLHREAEPVRGPFPNLKLMKSWSSPYDFGAAAAPGTLEKWRCTATFCTFCPKSFSHLQNFGQILSLACVDLLQSLGIPCCIKWPNDVLIDGKKIAGILCDIVNTPDYHFAANGIGLNVNMTQKQLDTIPAKAASLAAAAGKEFDIRQIQRKLEEIYLQHLETFLEKGFSPFLARYRETLPYRPNQKISFHFHNEVIQGFYHSLSENGSLNLSLPNNEMKNFVNIEDRALG